MKIALGSDDSTPLTDFVAEDLARRGHDVVRTGALVQGGDPRWPAVGARVGALVAAGECAQGVLFCYTGTGVSMAANKVRGVRAALCHDAETAAGARRWNDANVLVMSLRSTSAGEAREMLDAWFAAPPGDAEDVKMVRMLDAMDQGTALDR
ncbi:MAG: RpiB/LacA/LacB family sugar-phosphate isomerase [Chloroflexi bacterium]|nr:RpiB/LacA/LacB family sugar-phosphate isomerase [Chloroflexota bacterium]